MADIFISYAREDLERAKPLAEALEAHGWEVWWDTASLRTGQSFNKAIQEALSQVKSVVVLWSETSVQSKWVEAEAYWAWENDKLASVVLDQGLQLRVPFNTTHSENLCGWSGGTSAPAFRKLIADLAEVVGAPASSDEPGPTTEPPPETRNTRQPVGLRPTLPKMAVLGVIGVVTLVLAILLLQDRKSDQALSDPTVQTPVQPTAPSKLPPTIAESPEPEIPATRSTADTQSIELSPAQWREVQRALNDIGFDAGVVDGSPGAKIRNAIALFQESRGFPTTGELTESQRTKLLSDARAAAEGRPIEATESVDTKPVLPEMVDIPAGCFNMGSPSGEGYDDERPQHRVCVQAFALGKYEVTFAEYDRFCAATGRKQPADRGWGRGRRPVILVSGHDAQAYAEWLSEQTGRHYRLPTEAEWEYAARAGTDTEYWWGNNIKQDAKVWANCLGCGSERDGKQTAPIGSFPANAFGLYDTAGNVWEWMQDCWDGSYVGAPDDGSAWTSGDCARWVLRGGAWDAGPQDLRSAYRYGYTRWIGAGNIGFRLARTL